MEGLILRKVIAKIQTVVKRGRSLEHVEIYPQLILIK